MRCIGSVIWYWVLTLRREVLRDYDVIHIKGLWNEVPFRVHELRQYLPVKGWIHLVWRETGLFMSACSVSHASERSGYCRRDQSGRPWLGPWWFQLSFCFKRFCIGCLRDLGNMRPLGVNHKDVHWTSKYPSNLLLNRHSYMKFWEVFWEWFFLNGILHTLCFLTEPGDIIRAVPYWGVYLCCGIL